eukprot:CAMPEP_0203960758 /NCGR_PEP_ID=MMETSP0359-20131031/91366_1 /ASSEMBLY_ACC=CAM_ASM_000338 /TAXON_ID=268821 /ORGANISM="Scrippsiella Hangoei, Strain SHTV-5" /LENGTH=115 /DNA_ID=CAMNT_0050895239 /DNA_START=108 /DNA_END=454 /DNA_ORIENTATION=-
MRCPTGMAPDQHEALGSSYGTYFCGEHIAQRMAHSETTSRLDAWCRLLAYCINHKLVPPSFVTEVSEEDARAHWVSESEMPLECLLSPGSCAIQIDIKCRNRLAHAPRLTLALTR